MHMRESLSRLFPPPRFILLDAVGVDVSDTSLKYVQFMRVNGELKLKRWGDIAMPDGAIVQGVVHDSTALGKALMEVRRICGTPCMRLSLPEEHAYLFETKVKASLSEHEVIDAIGFRLEENVPLAPRDAEFDYTPTNAPIVGNEQKIIVTVYAKEIIRPYHEACEKAEVLPLSFEVEAQALARSVVKRGDKGVYLMVDFGKSRTGVGIVADELLELTSTVDIGGMDLDEGLALAYPKATADELITLKNQNGVLVLAEEKAVREALLPPVTNLKNEVAARMAYWNTRAGNEERQIKNVILCGGIANLAGLPAHLSETLGVTVSQADVWQNAFSIEKTIPPITRRYSYGYATAVGLSLGSFSGKEI